MTPIYVEWSWVCDICGIDMRVMNNTSVYMDEMARPINGWVSDLDVTEKYRDHPMNDICIACPDCKVEPQWGMYRDGRFPNEADV